jgi:hypothetical protein
MANVSDFGDKPKSKIEQAKDRLNSKYTKVRKRPRAHMHRSSGDASTEWKHEQERFQPKRVVTTPIFRKFFIGSLIFFCIAILVALFSLFGGRNVVSTDAIDIEILAKTFVDGGEEFEVSIDIANENAAPLELADLILEYPKNSVIDGEMARDRRALGTIRSGQAVLEEFDVVLFGEEGSERTLTAVLEYRVEGSNAIFVKETDLVVAIQSTPIEMLVEAPDEVINNQQITLDFVVESNATTATENLLVRVEYPAGFVFDEAEPAPTLGNNVWELGDLPSGGEKEISIQGVMKGQSGEQRVFRAFVGEQDPRNEKQIATVFNSAIHTLTVQSPFLGAEVSIDGSSDPEVPITSGKEVTVAVEWANTLPTRLTDVEVIASLSGSAYDDAQVKSNRGFFDSNDDAVVWNKTNELELGVVEPGESGTLFFTFVPRALILGSSVVDKPSVVVDVNVRGVDGTGNVRSASNVTQKKAIVNTDLQLTQQTLYYGGSFKNSGSYPPVVEETTQFTITWRITNSSNVVDNARITTTLPSYVDWLSRATPASEDITFNSVKREVTWNIGQVVSGAGFTADAHEVSFQLGVTPSSSQIERAIDITGDVVLSGDDRFTGALLRTIRRAHSTRLLNDIQPGDGKVVE